MVKLCSSRWQWPPWRAGVGVCVYVCACGGVAATQTGRNCNLRGAQTPRPVRPLENLYGYTYTRFILGRCGQIFASLEPIDKAVPVSCCQVRDALIGGSGGMQESIGT